MDAFHLFTLRGVPVRASMWFLLLIGYYAFALRSGGLPVILAFVLAITVSVLIHEFGHAMVARHFKLSPQVVLHGWGGLCIHERAQRDRDDALIIIAGPAAGLLFAGIVAATQALLPSETLRNPFVGNLMYFLWIINFWWSLVNLLPLFPLDGGQLFRLGVLRVVKPAARADKIVQGLGAALALAALIYAVSSGSMLIGIISAFLLFQNAQLFTQGSPMPVRRRNSFVDNLLTQSRETLDDGDPHEARRLAYQAKGENGLSADQVELTFQIIAIASAELGDWAEALDWSQRAPKTAALQEVMVEALIELGRMSEAKAELANPYLLTPDAKARLEAKLG